MDTVSIRPATAEELNLDSEATKIWNDILRLTGGHSARDPSLYIIWINIQIKMIDNELVFYTNNIHGYNESYYVGDTLRGKYNFDITLGNGKFIPSDGQLSFLEEALKTVEKRCEIENKSPPIIINRIILKYMFNYTTVINNFIKDGCPYTEIDGQPLNYKFISDEDDGTMSLITLSYGDITLNFLSLCRDYVEITDEKTKRRWIFTNTPGYEHINIPNTIYLRPVSKLYYENYESPYYPQMLDNSKETAAIRLLGSFNDVFKKYV